jgi:pepF/M3 family oligoendopeptidase
MPPAAPAETLPHWDVSNIYPGLDSDEFRAGVADLARRLDDLEAFLDQQHIARAAEPAALEQSDFATAVNGFLTRMNALLELSITVGGYVRTFVATDSFNAPAKRWLSQLDQYNVRRQRVWVRFQSWLGQQAALLPRLLAQPGPAAEHAFYLQELAEQSRYLMSDAEESLAAELNISGAVAWSLLQGTVTSQLTVPFEHNGQTAALPLTAVQNLMWHDPDPAVRRRAYEAELAALASVREPLAAALNGVKGTAITLNRRRGRTDALHEALDDARLDRATLDTLLAAMQASFPMFRRYLRAKAKRLGHAGALPWWDLAAPVLPPGAERHFTFSEAEAFIDEQFGRFSPSLAGLAQRAFRGRWIDAEPRAGKRGGAFCMGLPGIGESRILCNFDGSLDQLFTIAHELGHAYHNDCQTGKPELQTVTPMTLAETASTFCETLVTDAALEAAASPAEELSILETFLTGATQVVVDITSRYLFEKEVFERRAEAELSADDFCEIMLRCQAATYGDGLDERYRHAYMWTWKPHYYRTELSFYNYPYAFGLLFGIGLYAVYQERGAAFLADYKALLASTGEASPVDLAARFGIDLRAPAFWEGSLAVIGKRIERYEQL